MDLYLDINHARQLSLLPIESFDVLNTLRGQISQMPLLVSIRDVTQSGTSNNTDLTADQKELLCDAIINNASEIVLGRNFLTQIANQMKLQNMDYKLDRNGNVDMSQGSASLQFYDLHHQSSYMTGSYNCYNSLLSGLVHSQICFAIMDS